MATFPCNRMVGQDGEPWRWEYLDPGFDPQDGGWTFADLVEASRHSISSSLGWLQNRAWYVYAEAWAENEHRREAGAA